MKIRRYSNLILFFLASLLMFASCEKEDKTFTGASIVAFEVRTINHTVTQISPNDNLSVMLVGAQESQPKTVTFRIIDEYVQTGGDTVRTTAQSGIEYTAFASNTITFAPNSSFTTIPLTINFENLVRDSIYTLIFELVEGNFGVSPNANSVVVYNFTPHRLFIPEDFIGTFTAFETSQALPNGRSYNVTVELDSIYANGKIFEFLVDGLWNLPTSATSAGASNRQKIRIKVDDTDPLESIVSASTQDFFTNSTFGVISWSFVANGSFDTWSKTFNFPTFELKVKSNGNPFPSAANPAKNIKVSLVLD